MDAPPPRTCGARDGLEHTPGGELAGHAADILLCPKAHFRSYARIEFFSSRAVDEPEFVDYNHSRYVVGSKYQSSPARAEPRAPRA
ncbi:MAG: hypothetical protein H6713_19750 [Myxococcales bacterium]|nr:hypothetical protein [Myxococcales bacterium]